MSSALLDFVLERIEGLPDLLNRALCNLHPRGPGGTKSSEPSRETCYFRCQRQEGGP